MILLRPSGGIPQRSTDSDAAHSGALGLEVERALATIDVGREVNGIQRLKTGV